MNNSIFLARIIKRPIVKLIFTDPIISVINIKVQIQISNRKDVIVNLISWQSLEDFDIFNHYNVNDYVIVEGYLSYSDTLEKKLVLTAYKVNLFFSDLENYVHEELF